MIFGRRTIDFSPPRIMGVVNVTPDSFYDGGRIRDDRALLAHAERMLSEGADFLDIGGYSSRPGAADVSVDEELRRAVPSVALVREHFPEALISIDTFRARVAREAVSAGATLVNDISAGDDDPGMFPLVAELGVPYVAMHKQGNAKTMQKNPSYQDVVSDVYEYLRAKVGMLTAAGANDIIVDPGFGFGKTVENNYALLRNLRRFKEFGAPLLVGLSRKSMIQKVLGVSADEALNGTTVANTIALLNGADILRVHDVKPAKEAILLVERMKRA